MGWQQWWLAELDRYGNASLVDGPHPSRSGVEQALYLYRRLGLSKGGNFACAKVVLTSVRAVPHGANEEALGMLNAARLRPEGAPLEPL